MVMNCLSYLPQTVAQNDLVVESHNFVAAVLIEFSVYVKYVLITTTEMKINGSKFHTIITTVRRWTRMKNYHIYTRMVDIKWGRYGFTLGE